MSKMMIDGEEKRFFASYLDGVNLQVFLYDSKKDAQDEINTFDKCDVWEYRVVKVSFDV